ncbi:Abi family protein [uncultured Flavobacterium sp.]|uniref:Abi family protein n=1 Tax=uncultured Flavobacterium sp. TaxID=165435 RepID=UPI00259448C8|nr:Abi family protein [uncultured Flavobacterium sp.]
MANKPAYSIADQIALLKHRGMLFRNEADAPHFLENISYYRLKGYWWDLQTDRNTHNLHANTYFEDIIERYNFDRQLRLILFDAIERIEIALRTKMIHHLSMAYGGLWYLDSTLFENTQITLRDGTIKTIHQNTVEELQKEFNRSQEIFIKDHRNRYPGQDADAWKIMETASFGTLSKLYKAMKNQLPEKAFIAQEMGLNLHSELSSWLESINYVRNIIAHHSRLWSRTMVKTPRHNLNNPKGQWFINPLTPVQSKKPFLIITSMIYLCNYVTPGHQIKSKILTLFNSNPNIQIYKLGFLNNWRNEPLWTQP